MTVGIDYAWGRPVPQDIKSAGYGVVLRYLSFDASKNLSTAEAQALLAAGLDIGVVWESSAGRALSSTSGGQADGNEAKRQLDAIGGPTSMGIYFAVDFDATQQQWPVVGQYLAAAGSVIWPRPVGVYGPAALVDHMVQAGVCQYGWVSGGWRHGATTFPAAHIIQRVRQVVIDGVTCDFNDIQRDEFGGWRGGGSPSLPPAPAPSIPAPQPAAPEDPDMPFLIQYRDASKGLYITNGITKRWLETNEEIALFNFLKLVKNPGQPLVMSDVQVDVIPLVGAAPGNYTGARA